MTLGTEQEDDNGGAVQPGDELPGDVQAQLDAEDAAMAGGFTSAGMDPDEQAAAAAATPAEPGAVEAEQERYGGLTAAELAEAHAAVKRVSSLESSNQKLAGTVGALKQQLDAASKQLQGIKLDPAGMKRLQADFPELADAIAEDLNGLILGGGVQTLDPDAIGAVVDQRMQAKSAEQIPRILAVAHGKDWQQTLQSPEFLKFRQALPEDDRTRLENSWDGVEIAEYMTQFKAQRAEAEKVAAGKTRKLVRGIAPQGGGGNSQAVLSEEQAMNVGFKSVVNA